MFCFFQSDKPGFKYFQALNFVLSTGSGKLLSAMRCEEGGYIDDLDDKMYHVHTIAVVEGVKGHQYLCPINDKSKTELRPLAMGSDGLAHLLAEKFDASVDNTDTRWDQGVLTTRSPITVVGYTIVSNEEVIKPAVRKCETVTDLETPEEIIEATPQKTGHHASPGARA